MPPLPELVQSLWLLAANVDEAELPILSISPQPELTRREGEAAAEWAARSYDDSLVGVIGGWHCHPVREHRPSEADRESALVALDLLRERHEWRAPSQWLDVILYADSIDGWRSPRACAWSTYRRGNGAAVTKPARIEVA